MTASLLRSGLRLGLCMALLLAGGSVLQAQRHREPLTQSEIDQIRDASWEPRMRLTLYVQFTRDRLVKLEQMRSDPKTKDRPRLTHDMLDDFQLLYDELNDNIDTYVDRRDDIRKPLKVVIAADTEFQAKLRALKDAAERSRGRGSPVRIRSDQPARQRGQLDGGPSQAAGRSGRCGEA